MNSMMIFMLMVGIVPIIVISIFVFKFLNIQANAPIETVHAKVVSKRRGRANGRTSYKITFEVNGQLMELHSFSNLFYSINEGEEGTLVYKGIWVNQFTKNQ